MELSEIVPVGVGILIALMRVVLPRSCPSWTIRMLVWPVSMPIPVSNRGPKSAFLCIQNPPNIALQPHVKMSATAVVLLRLPGGFVLYVYPCLPNHTVTVQPNIKVMVIRFGPACRGGLKEQMCGCPDVVARGNDSEKHARFT
jgi:hypothetical protein